MADDLNIIQRFVKALVWRERGLLFLDIAARSALVLFVAVVLMVTAAALDWSRGSAAALLSGIVGVGLWAAVVFPLLIGWRRSGDVLRQARLAEADQPEFRGRLVTAVENAAGQSHEDALFGLVAKRAAAVVPVARPGRIHAAFGHVARLGGAFVLWLVLIPASLLAGGPLGVLQWWASGLEANAAVEALGIELGGEQASVGDLVLQYTYPAYTGLEPRVVENSTGDVQAPPGTQVRVTARSGEPVDAAGLVANDERLEAEVTDGRAIEGAFTVGKESGSYHLVTWRGESSQESKSFKINVEEDLAPEVIVDVADDRLELAVDEDFQLIWRARDDYGVKSVVLRIDGRAEGSPLYRMQDRKAEVFGDTWRRPAEMGLQPGDTVMLTIAAWDNDTFSGSKAGVSREIELVVLGAKGVGERSEARIGKFVDAMLTILADHLVDPWPVGNAQKDFADYGETVAKRYEPLQELIDAEWERLDPGGLEAGVLKTAMEKGSELVLYASVEFDPNSADLANMDAVTDLGERRVEAIEALENGILALDKLLRNQALAEAVRIAETMEEIGRDLEDLMAQDEPDALAMLAMLEQLDSLMEELAKNAEKLADGGLKEFLNARNNEMKSLKDEIMKAIREGRMEDARKMMSRLADQLQQTAEGLRDTMERQKGEGDDTMDQAQDLVEQMEELEQQQRELQDEVSKLREEADADAMKRGAAIWKEIREEVAGLEMELTSYRDGLTTGERGFNEVQRAENGLRQASRLEAAATAEDLRSARSSHRSTSLGVDAMYRALDAARFTGNTKGPGRREVESLYARLDKIQALLDKLEEVATRPELQEQTQELQQQQQKLQEELQQVQQQAQQLTQKFPVKPERMEENLGEAKDRMGEASEDLQGGRPMPAEGSQGAAAERIREAREDLERAMEQSSQQSQPLDGQPQEGNKQGQGDGEGQHDRNDRPQLEIPDAEEFQTPEEYRRALLEGMEGEVPDEFRAMKKRYFEELVRQ